MNRQKAPLHESNNNDNNNYPSKHHNNSQYHNLNLNLNFNLSNLKSLPRRLAPNQNKKPILYRTSPSPTCTISIAPPINRRNQSPRPYKPPTPMEQQRTKEKYSKKTTTTERINKEIRTKTRTINPNVPLQIKTKRKYRYSKPRYSKKPSPLLLPNSHSSPTSSESQRSISTKWIKNKISIEENPHPETPTPIKMDEELVSRFKKTMYKHIHG